MQPSKEGPKQYPMGTITISGGETIKSVLGFGCHTRMNLERRSACLKHLKPSKLSASVQGYLHCFQQAKRSILPRQATAFLYSLRHPLDRTISWFHYVHPNHCRNGTTTRQNCMAKETTDAATATKSRESKHSQWLHQFFVDCHFDTMQDWAQALELPSSQSAAAARNVTPTCHDIATNSLLGGQSNIGNMEEVPLASHLIANIRVNVDLTAKRFPNASIYVIRTEHLWDDLQQLDERLGGSGSFAKAVTGRVANAKRPHVGESSLSARQCQRFCCGLKLELLAYRVLVSKASNLSLKAKQETLDAAMQRCSFEDWDDLKSCDS
ncbi:hypothetical protein MPSEU_000362500 [Mayamaea pseudoterrestris]|nr:hypothetical protein MPSEU_000362500 [Mayamaea pseudoterrestris]